MPGGSVRQQRRERVRHAGEQQQDEAGPGVADHPQQPLRDLDQPLSGGRRRDGGARRHHA